MDPGSRRSTLLPPRFSHRPEEVEEELHAPTDASLQEAEVEVAEPMGRTTEDEGLGDGLAARGEGPDVVEHVAARRLAQVEAHRRGVDRDGHTELREPLPQRVVVVDAVEGQDVDPRPARRFRTRDAAVHHRRPEAEFDDRVLELGDGLVRGVGGDHRRRGEAVVQPVARVRQVGVEGAAASPAHLVVGVVEARQPHAGVEHREVQADLVHALVEQTGQERRRPIERVGRHRPPREG